MQKLLFLSHEVKIITNFFYKMFTNQHNNDVNFSSKKHKKKKKNDLIY